MRERVLFLFPLLQGGRGLQRAALHELVQLFALLPEKGGILFPKRIPPFEPPEKGKGSCPLTPHIGSLNLEELRSLRNRVRCTWLRHEPLRVVTGINRALLRGARVTVVWRRTACVAAALLRSPPLGSPSLSPHQSSILPCFSS